MLRKIMRKAHEIARKMEGDYQARLSLALKLAWKEERGNKGMSREEQYNSWYRRDKKFNQESYERTKKDRERWPEVSVEKIKELLLKGNFGIKKTKDRYAIMTFYNDDTMDMINVEELASGLQLEGKEGFDGVIEKDGIITGITLDEFVEIRDWAWENLEEVEIS